MPRRPCRARDQGLPGCLCATAACLLQCQRASRLDPKARFIHYAGTNKGQEAGPDTAPEARPGKGRRTSGKGTDVFGYRSLAERAPDDRFAVAWTLQSGVYSANTDERTLLRERQAKLQRHYPDFRIGEWLNDSALGYDDNLEAIYELGALRMVDIRAHPSDADPAQCLARGYDGDGRPLCPHGYRLRSNGYDFQARRTKYVCAQVCRREPRREGEPVAPVVGCPYLEPPGRLGQVVNVGKTLPDGSWRLARELPYGSPAWQARYGRRNHAESRNAQLERLGLKRMVSYGLDHDDRDVQTADFLLNLHTLGRLVQEATAVAAA